MSQGIESYPLHWPAGWQRVPFNSRSRFKVNFGYARDSLFSEIRRLGGKNVVLSTNVPLRNDGLPYARYASLDDVAAAVYFQYKGKPMCFACDQWNKVEDNIWAMCKTIEAIRGIERWAASDMIERAFTGFMALPGGSSDDWWSVLKIEKTATLEEIKQARNKLARIYHPDVGENPSHEMMGKINTAFERATAERG